MHNKQFYNQQAGDEVENPPKISPESLWCSRVAQHQSRIQQRDKQQRASGAGGQPALEPASDPKLNTHSTILVPVILTLMLSMDFWAHLSVGVSTCTCLMLV